MDGERILEAGWMVDGSGGPIRRRVRLTMAGKWIVRIQSDIADRIPGATADRYPADTVLPGLFDAHIHLRLSPTDDLQDRRRQLTATYAASLGGMRRRIGSMLAHGIVAARDAGDAGGFALRFRRSPHPEPAGLLRLRAAGCGWHAAGRYGRFVARPPQEGQSLAEAIAQDPAPGDHLKIIDSGLNSLTVFGQQTRPQFSREALTAAVAAGARRGLLTMVHANGATAVADALAAGAHSIEHGYFMGDETIGRLADTRVFWVPTVVPMAVHAQCAGGAAADIAARSVDHQLAQIACAHRGGVRLAMGTDAGGIGVAHGPALVAEMSLWLQAGVGLAAAVRAASGQAAALMELPDLGELAAGRRACLVVAPGPPEALPQSLHRIKGLIIDGRPVPGVGAGS